MTNTIRLGYLLIVALGAAGLIALVAVFAGLQWWAGLILLAVLDVLIVGWAFRVLKRRSREAGSP